MSKPVIVKVPKPSHDQLSELNSRLEHSWKKHLSYRGVIYPKGMQLADLLALYHALGSPVHKDNIAVWTKEAWSLGWFGGHEPGGDRQCRHLRPDGWHVLGSGGKAQLEDRTMADGHPVPAGCYVLVSVTTVAPSYERASRFKRMGRAGARDWADLCMFYDNKCAVCRSDGLLERGHMDPDKGENLDNLVPLCSVCNNYFSDDWILGDRGLPKFARKAHLLKLS